MRRPRPNRHRARRLPFLRVGGQLGGRGREVKRRVYFRAVLGADRCRAASTEAQTYLCSNPGGRPRARNCLWPIFLTRFIMVCIC